MFVYLAGPMTGILNSNHAAFDFATDKLRALGFSVFSPAENDRNLFGSELEKSPAFSRRKVLKTDTAFICSQAEIIALLPNWEKSKGALAERALGVALGLTIMELGTEFTTIPE